MVKLKLVNGDVLDIKFSNLFYLWFLCWLAYLGLFFVFGFFVGFFFLV
jgi:hypothetical protein